MGKLSSAKNFADDFDKTQFGKWEILIRRSFPKEEIAKLLSLIDPATQGSDRPVEVPSSEHTRVFKCNVCINGTRYFLYLKRHLCRSAWDFLKQFFRPSRAKRAFNASIMLQKNGFDVPALVGLFERRIGPFLIEDLLITEDVEHAKPIVEYFRDIYRASDTDTLFCRRKLIKSFGETIGLMHAKGIFHGDLQLGNVFARQEESTWRFFFLDNERTKMFERLPARLRLKNLVQLNMFRENIHNTDRMRFFSSYRAQNARRIKRDKSPIRKVLKKTNSRLENKRRPNRNMRKYHRTNVRYLRISTGRWLAVFDRSFCQGADQLEFVRRIDELMDKGELLKKGSTCFVSHFMWNSKDVVTKRYNHQGLVHSLRHTIKRPRAFRAWINGHRLMGIEIPTAKPLAYFEERKGPLVWKSYLVTEYVEGQMLYHFLRDSNVTQERRSIVARQVAEMLDKLGKYRITHGDLKHSNVLITETGPVLTDLDGMKVYRCNWWFKIRRNKDIARLKKTWTNKPKVTRNVKNSPSSLMP